MACLVSLWSLILADISKTLHFLRSTEKKRSELLEKTEELLNKRDNMGRLGRTSRPGVPMWFRRVEEVEIQVKKLEEEYEDRQSRRPFCRFCPSLNCRFLHKLRKKISQLEKKVVKLLTEEANFDFANIVASPSKRRTMTSETIVGMEPAFETIWGFIEDEKVRIIGIYGMAGVGKTTLLKQIHNELLNKIHGFDAVIWVQVSRKASTKMLQDAICKGLGLSDRELEGESEVGKASAIFSVLRTKRFVVLLDDIWQPVDLEKVGIQYDQSKSKVIFTTRFMDAGYSMGADKMFCQETLPLGDAWFLFQKVVGKETVNSHPDIRVLAQLIVRECCGLPFALIALGRALSAIKNIDRWKHTLYALRESPFNSGMGGPCFPAIKLSYDSLESEPMKTCFLYCCLFPEEFQIDKDKLIDYWVCERLMDGLCDIRDRRSQGYYIIERLIYLSLLSSEGNCVTMHQLLRQIALKIASDEGKMGKFFVRAGLGLDEVPIDPILEDAAKISLMDNHIAELPYSPQWYNVSTLLLCRNKFMKIPVAFFLFMTALEVLDLSRCEFEELPETIGKLHRLQYLNLSYTKLRMLPTAIQELIKLEFLDLSHVGLLSVIPLEVLPKFLGLRVLNVHHCGYQNWAYHDDKKEVSGLLVGGEKFLEELESLNGLENLEISINNDPALNKLLKSCKLLDSIKGLAIVGCKFLESLPLSSVLVMKDIRRLEVSDCPNLSKFVIDWSVGNIMSSFDGFLEGAYFNNLQLVKIANCWSLEEITWLSFAPNLQSLHVEECINLGEIINSHGHQAAEMVPGTFLKLKTLYLCNLPNLKIINKFPLPFPCLEEITVSYCPNLIKLPVDSNSAKNSLHLIKGQEEWFKALEWEDVNTKYTFLSYFIHIEL